MKIEIVGLLACYEELTLRDGSDFLVWNLL
jgi:hypothetical protein